MNAVDRFEHELPAALTDVAGVGRTDSLADILGQTAAMRQRPAWASLERWLPMDFAPARVTSPRVPWRFVAAAAALLLLGAAIALFAASHRRVPPPPFGPAANGVIPFAKEGDIFVGDPVTGESHRVVRGPDDDHSPTFSPDGFSIAFVRETPAGQDVYVVGDDGSNLHKITVEPLQGLVVSSWTADSLALVLGYDVDAVQRLEVVDAAGKAAPRLLATGIAADWVIMRPPTGGEILLRARVDGAWGLYAMGLDGSNRRLLAPAQTADAPPGQDLSFPAYSPDGSAIYFNRYTRGNFTPSGAWVMRADGSYQHPFSRLQPAPGVWEGELAPSPDGKWVLMWRTPVFGPGRLTIYPADGTGIGRGIGPEITGLARWSWAPDSTKVLLNYDNAAEGDQQLIDPVTGESTTAPWNGDTLPDWQRGALR